MNPSDNRLEFFSVVSGILPEPVRKARWARCWRRSIMCSVLGAFLFATGAALGVSDLSVIKSGPATALPGETIDYTVTVSNAGPDIATNVVVTDVAPAELTLTTPASTNLGDLVAGDTTNVTFSGTVDPAFVGSLTTSASVTNDTPDVNLTNNADPAVTEVDAVDLSVTKIGPAEVDLGAERS